MENIFKTIFKKIIFIGIYFKTNIEIKIKFKFVLILLLAITINSCFLFELTEDSENARTTKAVEIKGALLLAGQSNMEGHVESYLYNDILNLISSQNGSSLQSNLEASLKNWYNNYNNGYASYAYSDSVNSYEAQELLRLKNENIVGNFLKTARSDVWCSFNSNTVSGLKEGFGYPIGPELTLGHYLGNKANSSISLIKVAYGGTNLYNDWLSPTAAARLGKSIGPRYTALKNRILSIKSNPSSVNPDYSADWKGFIWLQGENDCFDQINAQTYEANLKDLIKDVRNEIGNPNLPVVIVELNYWAQTLSYGNVVKAAQNAVASSDPNIELVKINDLSQFYHMDPAAQLIAGERIGKSLEKLLALSSFESINGLSGEYFHNNDLSDPAFVKVDREINFNWGMGSPDSDIGSDTFSARWTGYIKPEYSQKYTFYTNSDDGVRLVVDNKVIIDNWTGHAPTEDSGTITLQANKYYSIQLEYFENYGGATIQLFWSSSNQPKEIIPFAHLYNNNKYRPGGLNGTYYKDINLQENVFSRVDPTVNFSWNSSPDSSMDADFYSVRWTGYVIPVYSQTYTFTTRSDDGVRLWVDDKQIIDNWTIHAPQDDTGTISLQAGKLYKIKLEYYEYAGGAQIELYWASSSQGKEIIPSVYLFYENNLETGTEPLAYGMRNTILVSMPMGPSVTWKDMAFLAAVPAGMKINSGKPSVIAIPDNSPVNTYHYNYLDRYKPTDVFAIGSISGYSGTKHLNASSLDDLTCDIARFWQKSDTVVMVNSSDYRRGLSASALSGRLNAPLFYWNNTTISAKVMDSFNRLGVNKVIVVGSSNNISGQLNGAGIGFETIANPEDVVSWLVKNGHEVDYFAVCNSYDRTNTYAPRSSLAAPILAAARGGAVVPLNIAVEFNRPCELTETQTRPNGAAMSQPYQSKSVWKVGTCTVNGQNYNVAISRRWSDWEHFSQANVDFNRDGDYSDSGEFFVKGAKRSFGGKEYIIDIGGGANYADVRFSSPHADVIKANIQNFHNSLGHHPKYMALVGLPDAIPPLLMIDSNGRSEEWFTDQFYSNVDSDPMVDIALGRIVAENASYSTLAATRSVTYRDLLDESWMNRSVVYGPFNGPREQHQKLLQNKGFAVDLIPNDDVDRDKYNIYVQEGHGWPYGIAPQTLGPVTPSFTSTGGCSFGNITHFYDPGKEYKDFAAVQLARTGSVGFHAYGINAPDTFTFARKAFLNELLYQDATLGEAYLYSQNSCKMLFNENTKDLMVPMFYGDPALKIYLPPAQPTNRPARVEVNGNTATLLGPDNIWVYYYPNEEDRYWNHKDMPYEFQAPGLAGTGCYALDQTFEQRADKRFIAKFTVNWKINNITQQSGIPDNLGWFYSNANSAEEYRIDEHWDGSSTAYINARLFLFNYYNGKIDNSVSKISYSLTGDSGPDGNSGPAGYTWCTNEGGSFTLPGTADVAYGANGKYTYLYNKTGTITFNNNTFGDPIQGVYKAGYYKLISPTTQTVGFKSMANSKYVCAEDGGNTPLIANRSYVGHWESFDLIYNNDGTISLHAKANNKYVSLESNLTLIANKSTIAGDNEKFYMILNDNGTVSFKSKANGKYVCAENWGDSSLLASRNAIDTWEEFVLEYQ